MAFTGMLLLALASCDQSAVYKEYQDLSDNLEWRRSDVRQFEYEVTENNSPYDTYVAFRHAVGFPYREMHIRVEETGPGGEVSKKDVIIPIRNENGEWTGKADGDIVDIEYALERNRTFRTWGKYSYRVTHTMPMDTVHLAMEVGLVIRKKSE